MMYYSEAAQLMQAARNPERGKPLQNNTRLYARYVYVGDKQVCAFAVRLHNTDVVTLRPDANDGTLYVLSHGGWDTVTTKDRIETYAPVRIVSVKGAWYLRTRPDANDPEPRRIGFDDIPAPYTVPDPGPEPVKSPNGCIAGTLDEFEAQEDMYVLREDDLHPADFITKRGSDSLYVRRASNAAIYYGEDDYSWQDDGWQALFVGGANRWTNGYSSHVGTDGRTYTYKQCPHCAAFDRIHREWDRRMNGEHWGRHSGRGFAHMREMLDRFGSLEAWREARREHVRAARAASKAHREWWDRNHIAFWDGIAVTGDGYPLAATVRRQRATMKRIARERAKAERHYERLAKRAERERIAREREEERKRRFVERARNARRDPYMLAAENAVESLRTIALRADASSEEA